MRWTFDLFTAALRRVRQTQLSVLRAETVLLRLYLALPSNQPPPQPPTLIDRILSVMNGEFMTAEQLHHAIPDVHQNSIRNALCKNLHCFERRYWRPGRNKTQEYRVKEVQ